MRAFKLLAFLTLFFCLNAGIGAAELPKFGKISQEELQMTSIPEDPEADAVWLFDKGDTEIFLDSDGFYKMRLKYHGRIKILTEEGKDYADFRIPYWHKDRITSLKAHAVLANGKEIKLEKKNIFDEEVKNLKYKVFAIPGVEAGAVIECELEKISERLYYLEPWYFQNSEFTRVSQYSVTMMPGFSYNIFFWNTPGVEAQQEDARKPGANEVLKKFTWIMENLPPVRKEPYMRTLEDYKAVLHFQLMSYKDQYQYIKYITTWPELVAEVKERYKEPLQKEGFLEDLVQGMNLAALPDEEKIKTFYNYVRDRIETSSDTWIFSDKESAQLIKESKGSTVEKNLLLVNLLNIAGFKAYPVLISTRDNGKVSENVHQLTQFNRVLVYARQGLNSYIMDTSDKHCPFKTLPTNDLVENGLLIDEGEGKFIKIPQPRTTNMIYCRTTALLSEEGDLRAVTDARLEGYRAINARKHIASDGEEAFIIETLKESYGEVEIDSFKIEEAGNREIPLVIRVSYRVPHFAQITGDMIYLRAPVLNAFKENPFEREKRYFPVEFLYNWAETEDIDLTLPGGFQVMEIPGEVASRRHQNKLTFMNTWASGENNIKLQRQFIRQEVTFQPKDYSDLRNFYDSVVKADQAQIVLGRVGAAVETNR